MFLMALIVQLPTDKTVVSSRFAVTFPHYSP
jgi:hypothetical protein